MGSLSFTVRFAEESEFKSLEGFLNGWTHNENEPIARKNDCHVKVRIQEFEALGVLRAGPRLQLVRLATALRKHELALAKEEVVCFLQAALWQAGPPM